MPKRNRNNEIIDNRKRHKIWDQYKYTDNDIADTNRLIDKYKNADNQTEKKNIGTDDICNNMLGWVSGTRIKYCLMNDKCLDWLSMYYDKYGIVEEALTDEDMKENSKMLKDASHINLLLEGGNIFEKKIFENLAEKFRHEFVMVFDDEKMEKYRERCDFFSLVRENNKHVKKLMNDGIPIIAQAPLINDNNRTYGVADLLVRSDYIAKIFSYFHGDNEISIVAPKLTMMNNKKYHYRVIDIKWTTMLLCVDGVTIRNQGYFPAYKGQLAIYTSALEQLQGYIPNYAYIMAKAWKIGTTNYTSHDKHLYMGYSAYDRPGIINYMDKDNNYVSITKSAIQWVQRVMTDGRNWRYGKDKPTVPELYPNMKVNINPVFNDVKNKIAKRYGELTMGWYINLKNRITGHANGITDIRDDACCIDKLGIKNGKRGKLIEQIIDINKYSQTHDLVRPTRIKNNSFNWQSEHYLDMYVDFETINYNLFSDPTEMNVNQSYYDSDVTYMIGIGFKHNPDVDPKILLDSLCIDKSKCNIWFNKDNDWEFICIYLTDFELKCELEMYRLFLQFVIIREEVYKQIYDLKDDETTRLFHWSIAELRFLDSAMSRIKSGKYTEYHLDNQDMIFETLDDNESSESIVSTIQNELNELFDVFKLSTTWIDMYEIFQKEPILVKGSYKFKLKHVGNSFYQNGLISTIWDDGELSDGFIAMLEAIKLYRNNKTLSTDNEKFMKIVKYNEVDCKVIWEIVKYLRIHHCSK